MGISKSGTRGEVVWKDVSFHYVNEQPVLENINLSVKPGQSIAFVGPTGSGNRRWSASFLVLRSVRGKSPHRRDRHPRLPVEVASEPDSMVFSPPLSSRFPCGKI